MTFCVYNVLVLPLLGLPVCDRQCRLQQVGGQARFYTEKHILKERNHCIVRVEQSMHLQEL